MNLQIHASTVVRELVSTGGFDIALAAYEVAVPGSNVRPSHVSAVFARSRRTINRGREVIRLQYLGTTGQTQS